MTTKEYNGYANYETWKLAVNIDNEEGLYNDVLDIAKSKDYEMSGDDFQNYIEDFCSQINSEEIQKVGYQLCDFWSINEWSEIDFDELAEQYNKTAKENNEYEEKESE